MNALIIYDSDGHIWNTTYGDSITPSGLFAAQVDVPPNAQVTGVEIKKDGTVVPQYESMPLSDWQAIEKAIEDANKETLNQIDKKLNNTIDYETCSLGELKEYQINKTKELLSTYLRTHPLVSTCHANKEGVYTITEEKRNMFTSKFTAHMALVEAGIDDVMMWNESGQVSEPWTTDECILLMKEWDNISSVLVRHQQNLEILIRSCMTKEEIIDIAINYAECDPRGVLDIIV